MSRSKKGSKGPGHEYWGKRPGTKKSGGTPGKFAKKVTHRAERIEASKAEKQGLEICPVCDTFQELEGSHYCPRCDDYTCACCCDSDIDDFDDLEWD